MCTVNLSELSSLIYSDEPSKDFSQKLFEVDMDDYRSKLYTFYRSIHMELRV